MKTETLPCQIQMTAGQPNEHALSLTQTALDLAAASLRIDFSDLNRRRSVFSAVSLLRSEAARCLLRARNLDRSATSRAWRNGRGCRVVPATGAMRAVPVGEALPKIK